MAVTRLDKITGSHLESIQAPSVLLNGYFLQLGELVDGETEMRKATAVVDPKAVGEIVFHATPEVMADARKTGLKHFQVEALTAGRGYHLSKGDRITLTEDLFETVPVVGTYVTPQAGSFLLDTYDAVADIDNAIVLKVIRETTLGYDNSQAFVLQVTKA